MTVEVIELEDHISGPAHAAGASLDATAHAAQVLKKALGGLGDAGGAQQMAASFQRASGPIAHVQEQLERLRASGAKPIDVNVRMQGGGAPAAGGGSGGGIADMLGGAGGGAGEGAGAMAGGLAAGAAAAAVVLKIVESIAAALKRAAEFALDLAIRGSELAIQMSSFKHETLESFTHLTGSSAEADRLFEKMQKISDVTGEAPSAVMGRLKKLLADGFKEDEASRIMTDAADIAADRGEASAQKFQTVIETLKNKGTADKSFLSKGVKAGLDQGDIYAALASRTHKSIEAVKADLKSGRVAADDAIAALEAASEKRFGGAAQRQADSDPLLQFASVKKNLGRMFEDIDLSPIAGALKNVNDVLGGGAGAELKSAFKDLFGGIFDGLFGELKGGDAKQKMTDFIRNVAEGVRGAASVARAVAPVMKAIVGFGLSAAVAGARLFAGVMDVVGGVAEALSGPLEAVAGAIRVVTGVFDSAVDMISAAWGGISDIFSAAGSIFSDAFDAVSEVVTGFLDIGSQMIDGLIEGIDAGAAGVVDAIIGTVSGAVDAAKAFLGIASPSKAFAQMGAFSAQGFAGGIAANDGAPAAASAAMAQRSVAAATYGAASAGNGAAPASGDAGGPSVTMHFSPVIHVTAEDAEGGKKAGEAAAKAAEGAFRTQFARLMRESREAA